MKRKLVLLTFLLLAVVAHGNNDTNAKREYDDCIDPEDDADDVTDFYDDDDDVTDSENEEDEIDLLDKNDEDLERKPKTLADIPGLTESILGEALDQAKKENDEEESKFGPGITQAFHDAHYGKFNPTLEPGRQHVLATERMVKIVAKKLRLTVKETAEKLDGLPYKRLTTGWSFQAEDDVPCNPAYLYRTVDGSCNNLCDRNVGAAKTAFSRVVRPDYADGMSAPRRSKRKGRLSNNKRGRLPLTNARHVSRTVFRDENHPSKKVAHMLMIWGQYIDHDITIGAAPNLNCSSTCGLKGECFGIPISKGDLPFKGRTCIQMTRNVPFAPRNGKINLVREQVNEMTSFIDASQVYGNTVERFTELRNPTKPWLLAERTNPHANTKPLLPREVGGFCRTTNVRQRPCFVSGDVRTNENPGLTSLHTIFLREHNRIATELKKINATWSNDKVFFETRKIVGAEIQHITYNEFLPLVLDYNTRRRFGLNLLRSGFYKGYNSRTNPSIINSFAAAAYRFGHSLVRNTMNRYGPGKTRFPRVYMNQTFNPTPLYFRNGVDKLLRGFARDQSQKVDAFFAKAVQEQLVRGPGDLSDLAAINIQRGREHGLPGYNTFRKICRLPMARSFSGFRREISQANIKKLKKVYAHPDDVDLFVGGVMEKPKRGGIVGPTFSCLLGAQFSRLRRGDRFWYETNDRRIGFTSSQLQDIRRVSLARVICENSDNITKTQRRVLAVPSAANRVVSCNNLPRLNLRKWAA